MTVDTPDQVPEPIQPMEVEREKVTQIPVQIPQIPKRVKTSNAPYFVYKKFESKTDAPMDVEPTSHKRTLEESKAERIKKAIKGDQIAYNIPEIVDRLTIPQIKQQLIIYDVDFPQKNLKKNN